MIIFYNRFTEKDDRVLVMMEDDTNDKSSLSSQVDIDYSGTQQDNRGNLYLKCFFIDITINQCL